MEIQKVLYWLMKTFQHASEGLIFSWNNLKIRYVKSVRQIIHVHALYMESCTSWTLSKLTFKLPECFALQNLPGCSSKLCMIQINQYLYLNPFPIHNYWSLFFSFFIFIFFSIFFSLPHPVYIILSWMSGQMTVNDVYISFLPLAHILDRMIEEYFFHKGAAVGYFHGVRLQSVAQHNTIICFYF